MPDQLSGTEMTTLVDAMYAVLALVAGADGEIDPKEVRRFKQMLEAAQAGPLPLLAAVASTALASIEEHLAAQDNSVSAAIATLKAGAQVAHDRLEVDEARRFKHGLYMMGTQLATASGGGVLGLGARTSGDEEKALQTLADALGVRPA